MRPDFQNARSQFVRFLVRQGFPAEIDWVSCEHVARRKQQYWIRAADFVPEADYAGFYERLRATRTSIRIDALGTLDGRTLAYVENYGGDGSHLNFGVPTGRPPLKRTWGSLGVRLLRHFASVDGGVSCIPTLAEIKGLG